MREYIGAASRLYPTLASKRVGLKRKVISIELEIERF